jgi:hypothetical protein
MALDAVGSVIYVNQQMASVASEHNARDGRVEMQNFTANAAAMAEEKKVKDLRPTEENKGLDADREHQRQESEEEQKRSKKRVLQSEDEDDEHRFHLDIKV